MGASFLNAFTLQLPIWVCNIEEYFSVFGDHIFAFVGENLSGVIFIWVKRFYLYFTSLG